MRKIKILVDSCSDLNKDLLDRYDLDYCKMNTVYHDEETPASLNWEYYSPKELYGIMRKGERLTTTQVPICEFETVFKKYLDEEYDIIYIGCSSKQSGSVNTATLVANNLLEEYPDAKIACIDSLNASAGEGLVAIYAADCLKNGDDFDTIVSKANGIRNHVRQYVTVNTLEWLRKAGRVKATSAFFGDIINVKPILISDYEGYQVPIKKVRGRKNSLHELVELMASVIDNPADQTIYIAHADAEKEELDLLKDTLQTRLNPKSIEVVYIGPIIGASIGPDAIGIWALGKEITADTNSEA